MTNTNKLRFLASRGYSWTSFASNKYIIKSVTTPDGHVYECWSSKSGREFAKDLITRLYNKELGSIYESKEKQI